MKSSETIVWLNAKHLPDADTTFLLHAPNADEPVWPGYWDGDQWCWADGTRAAGVIAYANMPKGRK